MSFVGTFGSFTVARLGIYAAQKGLSVTGNNIANINTRGYTRQSLDQISLRVSGSDRYQSQSACRVGTGVLPVGVSQIWDPYLDIRYRNEMASVGAADGKLAGLEQIASVLDEVAKGGDENGLIEAQLSDLLSALQNLNVNTGQDDAQIQVRTSAEALVKLFNTYAKRLEDVKNNAEKHFEQDVRDVNGILTSIRDLNSAIRKAEIHGDSALELRDERNRLIDDLSQQMKIDVIYEMEDLGGGQQVEKLTIKLPGVKDKEGKDLYLVDGTYARQFNTPVNENGNNPNFDMTLSELKDVKDRLLTTFKSSIEGPATAADYKDNFGKTLVTDDGNGTITEVTYGRRINGAGQEEFYSTTVTKTYAQATTLGDNDLHGALQSAREILTEAGEFTSQDTIDNVDLKAGTKRGIPYYQKSLDLLANKIATVFNGANRGKHPDAGNLFKGDNNGTITAASISISDEWANGTVKIVNSFDPDAGSTANDNILHMIALMDTKMEYDPTDVDQDSHSTKLFHGTFQEMLTNIGTVLGNDQRMTTIELETYHTASLELDTSRDAVSGVDLNDEAAGLMQYQKSYAAACRLMTTLDEVLDKLINGTGIAGR